MAKDYTPINLPKELVEELKVWKQAFGIAYGDPSFSYERMIRGMLDSLQVTEPSVVEELERLTEKNPALVDMLGHYKFITDKSSTTK